AVGSLYDRLGQLPAEEKRLREANRWLLRHNDPRTHAAATVALLALDNCRSRIELPVWHVAADAGYPLDTHLVEQHLHVVCGPVHILAANPACPIPGIVDEQTAGTLLPPKLRRILARLS